ncbi:MAG: M18 family aminopeptidase [Lachnospiraceae bacterium]|nr:M18 family aminopeptidase [Lachnospiraceae bacterium]
MTDLLEFINNTSSPFHVVKKAAEILEKNDFEELVFNKKWELKKGHKYYTMPYRTSLYAFHVPLQTDETTGIKMVSSHTDYPCLRVKPNPETVSNGYMKLNIEPYGGLIRNTWLDRPLSIAGIVALKSSDALKPNRRYVDFKRPILVVPNLAIHMNRKVNEGVEINPQTQLQPILGMISEEINKDKYFMELLAKELSVKCEDILDFDLYVYNVEKGCRAGISEEFLSAPRLDNVSGVVAALNGLIGALNCNKDKILDNDIKVACFYDNEEIGSRTKQGADSSLTNILINKIGNSLKMDNEDIENSILNGFMLSIDVAHAVHPNYSEKSDPTNIVKINDGVVLKINTSQKYATDTEAIAGVMQLCMDNDIPYQKFVNRADSTGGGTLGTITSSWLPMKTVDLGIPLLAMHSSRELGGIKDQDALEKLVKIFFME